MTFVFLSFIPFAIFTVIIYSKNFKDKRPDLGGFGGRKDN